MKQRYVTEKLILLFRNAVIFKGFTTAVYFYSFKHLENVDFRWSFLFLYGRSITNSIITCFVKKTQ